MYRALESFTTANYDVKRKQILADDFTTQEEIQDLLQAGYIKVDDGTIDITKNGQYNLEGYDMAVVNVEGTPAEVDNLIDTINGEVI